MSKLGRVLRFFRPESDRLAVVVLLMLLGIGANLLKPWPLAVLIDTGLGDKPLPRALALALDPSNKAALVLTLSLGLLVVYLAQSALVTLLHYLVIQVGLSGLRRVRDELFTCLQRLSLRFHQGSRSGELVHRAAWDTYAFQAIFQQGIHALSAILTLLFMILLMWRLNIVLTLVSLTMVPLLLLVLKGFGEKIIDRSQTAQQADSQVTSFVQQSIAALPLVQSYTREDYEESAFTSRSAAAMQRRLTQHRWELGYWLAIAIVFATGTAGLAWFGAKQVLAGRLSTGELLVFLAYLTQWYEPLNQLARVGTAVSNALGGTSRIFEILDAPEDIRDTPNARPVLSARELAIVANPSAPAANPRPALPRAADPRTLLCQGAIAFEQVSFAYQRAQPVLRELNFHLRAGQSAAVIGPRGVGKTTLLNLLPRFFDPTAGVVKLDGEDLRQLRLRDLRRQIALVLQEPILLPASLAENIAYGKPRASRREIEAAARAANADRFIEKLPNGYTTIIGEGGTRLSLGERQRINLARAFLKNAPVLLLDEPTSSALDAESEALVTESLFRLMEGRTTVLVAHRLTTLQRVDRVLVLQDGRLTEDGAPHELAERPGYYARVLTGAAPLD